MLRRIDNERRRLLAIIQKITDRLLPWCGLPLPYFNTGCDDAILCSQNQLPHQ